MKWIVNEHGCQVPLLLNFAIKFRYCWQPNVEDYHLCIYSNSGRLEKHSVLKFICLKLLRHCNIFIFRKGSSLVFFFYNFHDFLYVLVTWYIMFTFFSIWFLASAFWHSVSVLKNISYFVSISSATFWHRYSTHAYLCSKLYVFWP